MGGGSFVLSYFMLANIPIASYVLDKIGLSTPQREIYKIAQNQVDNLTSGDMTMVNSMIFPEMQVFSAINPEHKFETDKGQGFGLITYLLEVDSITVKSVEFNNSPSITYKIKSPNLTGFFDDCAEDLQEADNGSEVIDILKKYVRKQGRSEFTVSLQYTYSNGRLSINYLDFDFINAISGGLLASYTQLYQNFFETYEKEIIK